MQKVWDNSMYNYAGVLAENPYFKELPHNIVATMNLSKLPEGCIFIYDAQYKSGNHPDGHVSVKGPHDVDYGGITETISKETTKQATHIRVFVPIKIHQKKDAEYVTTLEAKPPLPIQPQERNESDIYIDGVAVEKQTTL